MRTSAIIVGADGTPMSQAAVDWAAREAQRRRMPLRIVHAYDGDRQESRYDIGNEDIDVARKLAEAVTAVAARQALTVAPDIDVQADIVNGHATAGLIEVADFGDLLVVGSRGRGGFAGLLLGSVSQQLAVHACCPVVVVRGDPVEPGGPVVVGVEDSPAADRVLETAFDAAAARKTNLLAIRAYVPAIPFWASPLTVANVDTPDQDVAEQARLDDQLAPWRAKYPDVPVGTVLTYGSAAGALIAASRAAQLVIVGSHGHGVVVGAVLGSTGSQLLHHADCPVHLVRQP